MKTIEERANEYADTKVTPYDEPMYDAWRQAIMNDYLAGAKEQKKIDIEKACEWLMTNLEIPEDGVISEEEGKELFGDKPVTFIEEFRKAMEDEIWR